MPKQPPGSRAPPGEAYVIKRDSPPSGDGPGPVYLTRLVAVIELGPFTTNRPDARLWLNRPAAYRFLQRNQARPEAGVSAPLDAKWYVARLSVPRQPAPQLNQLRITKTRPAPPPASTLLKGGTKHTAGRTRPS